MPGVQVDLVIRAVQAEADRTLSFAAAEVVDEQGLYLLNRWCSVSLPMRAQRRWCARRLPFRPGPVDLPGSPRRSQHVTGPVRRYRQETSNMRRGRRNPPRSQLWRRQRPAWLPYRTSRWRPDGLPGCRFARIRSSGRRALSCPGSRLRQAPIHLSRASWYRSGCRVGRQDWPPCERRVTASVTRLGPSRLPHGSPGR